MQMSNLWRELELGMLWPLESNTVCLGVIGEGERQCARLVDEAVAKSDQIRFSSCKWKGKLLIPILVHICIMLKSIYGMKQ